MIENEVNSEYSRNICQKKKAKSFVEVLAEKVADLTVKVKPERMITFHL